MKSNAFLGAITKATLLVLALLTTVLAAQAQSWTNSYDGPDHYHDEVTAIAVDRNGNVIVTGLSFGIGSLGDYATIKYSSAGVPLWTNRYNGLANAGDQPFAVALDTNGNVFVTGGSRSPGEGSQFDLTTILYSSDGVALWTNRYDGPAHSEDGGTSLAVDSSGNAIVTGYTYSGPDFFSPIDFLAIKYSNAGLPLWTNRFGPVASAYGSRCWTAVDREDNVFVTGNIYRNGSIDWGTVKYSGAGVALWTNVYDVPGTRAELSVGLALDANGNVFVTGYTYDGDQDYDWVTIAYSNGGVPLWTNRFNGPGSGQDIPADVAVDSNNNVFVAGSAWTGNSYDYLTIKYSNSGVPMWSNYFNGLTIANYAQTLAVDGSGTVYVTGVNLVSTTNINYTTIAYSGAGMPLRTNWFSRDLSEFSPNTVYSAVDPVGNLVVAASPLGMNWFDFITVRYATTSPLPSLSIQRLADSIILRWTDTAFRLQASGTITGTFTNVPGAMSPYTSPASATQQYFRLAN